MEKVRLGVIGCGVIGQYHLRYAAQAPQIDLAAVADIRRDVAQEAAGQFAIPTVYNDGQALLDDPRIDAVVLAMPTSVRSELALAALERGKHVLLEKPAAMNVAQIKQMIAVRGDRVVACCSSRYRSLKSAQAAARYVASGKLGEIRLIHCRAMRPAGPPPQQAPPLWRLNRRLNGGGIFVNWGSYDLDYLLGICGWQRSLQPRCVSARTWTVAPHLTAHVAEDSDAETHVVALIHCENGAVIHYERAEMAAITASADWQIIGSEGSLRLPMHSEPRHQVYLDHADSEQGVQTELLFDESEDGELVHAGPVNDFAGAILEKRQPRTNLENALILQAITDAVYASAQRNEPVGVDEELNVVAFSPMIGISNF